MTYDPKQDRDGQAAPRETPAAPDGQETHNGTEPRTGQELRSGQEIRTERERSAGQEQRTGQERSAGQELRTGQEQRTGQELRTGRERPAERERRASQAGEPARPLHAPGANPPGTPGRKVPGAQEREAAPRLLPQDESDKLTLRLQEALNAFVDGPRRSVEEAAGVLEEAAEHITKALAERHRSLRAGWDGTSAGGNKSAADGSDTEDLRLSLRNYREVTERLLQI